ncbi:transglutaminase domain-containing protein [Solidesulfovibrio sp.]|uniref:transglutaminase domain-containing protein n=1 Tax=Solidesulfovibrio sp. TaxID=2910990 RepID=UPI002624AC7F|nr:transglutaminase domain-containing protein [Solidesulfovibrio sp.]
MPALEDYLYSVEALAEEALTGQALCALRVEASGGGTCGVSAPGEGLPLPVPVVAAQGDWLPLGACALPVPGAAGVTPGWRYNQGAVGFLLPTASGQAGPAILVALAATPLFALAATGAKGAANLPGAVVAAASENARHGDADLTLGRLVARAFACALDSPVANAPGSAAVTALLGRGDPELADAAALLAGGATGHDATAAALLAGVAGAVRYADEADGEDVWNCALATYFSGSGDCEDGAILLHALLLAAGLPADRLVTAFGRVGLDRAGHAWVAYRRESDGLWTVLDWTLGAGQGAVAGLPVLGEAAYYALVDYALTADAFFIVRQRAADFFARALAESVVLPALDLAGEAASGGRGAAAVASGFVRCAAACGARAECRAVSLAASGSAGSAWAGANLGAVAVRGLAGALAWPELSPAQALAVAGGGGGGAARLPSARAAAKARQLSAAFGRARLSRLRERGSGLAGSLGLGGCRLPAPAARLRALAGPLAAGEAAPPLPGCLALGGPLPWAEADFFVVPLGAMAQGSAPGQELDAAIFDHAAGEEWA